MRLFSPAVTLFVSVMSGLLVSLGMHNRIEAYRRYHQKMVAKDIVSSLLSCQHYAFQDVKKELSQKDIIDIEQIIDKYIVSLEQSENKAKTKSSEYQHMIDYFSPPLIKAAGDTIPDRFKILVVSKFIETIALISGLKTVELSLNTAQNTISPGCDIRMVNLRWNSHYSNDSLAAQVHEKDKERRLLNR
jgi:hypothetical protein